MVESVKTPGLEKKPSKYPKLMILASCLLTLIGVMSLSGFFLFPKYVIDSLLVIAGIWMLMHAISKGLNKSHREILKKYI
jgi:hypothetical protein